MKVQMPNINDVFESTLEDLKRDMVEHLNSVDKWKGSSIPEMNHVFDLPFGSPTFEELILRSIEKIRHNAVERYFNDIAHKRQQQRSNERH
jgi:hypothetical protein